MKKLIVTLGMVAVMMGCNTIMDKGEQEARTAMAVNQALSNKQYKINIRTMYPRGKGAVHVSSDFTFTVKGDTLVSYLPYFGRAYSIPYGGGKGLNFTERIRSYTAQHPKSNQTRIEMTATNEEDTYHFLLTVFDNGQATIALQAREREFISYDGEIDLDI